MEFSGEDVVEPPRTTNNMKSNDMPTKTIDTAPSVTSGRR